MVMTADQKQLTVNNLDVPMWKHYPKYKDSGVELLGEVPEGWTIKRIGIYTKLLTGYAFESELFSYNDEHIKLVRGDNVTTGKLRWGDKTRYWPEISKYLERYLLKENDIVIGMDGSKVGKNYAIVKEEDLPLILVQRVACIRCMQSFIPSFVFYSIANDMFYYYVNITKTDPAVPHITLKNIRDYPICFPPLPEQRAISSFLDRQTAHLDSLISKKERLIALLEEKRAALISSAVTKGLDPNLPMKDSGVEWFGKVPEHWNMNRLRFVCKINPSKSEVSTLPSDTFVSFLPMEMIDENGMISLEETRTIGQVWGGFTYFKENDVLLAKITPCFENGKGAICSNLLNGIGFGTTELHIIRSVESSNSRFIYYITKSNSFRKIGKAMMYGTAGQQRVPEDFIKDFRVGLPPLPEQRAIASFLDRETARIDALILKVREGIEKMKEYRTALISAAVTGKIDVRKEINNAT
jgi:type I restriction enzyme S subunit